MTAGGWGVGQKKQQLSPKAGFCIQFFHAYIMHMHDERRRSTTKACDSMIKYSATQQPSILHLLPVFSPPSVLWCLKDVHTLKGTCLSPRQLVLFSFCTMWIGHGLGQIRTYYYLDMEIIESSAIVNFFEEIS